MKISKQTLDEAIKLGREYISSKIIFKTEFFDKCQNLSSEANANSCDYFQR